MKGVGRSCPGEGRVHVDMNGGAQCGWCGLWQLFCNVPLLPNCSDQHNMKTKRVFSNNYPSLTIQIVHGFPKDTLPATKDDTSPFILPRSSFYSQ